MSKLFRIRTSDGFVSPATGMTNVHGVDMGNVLVPFKVGIGILKKQIDWHDAVRCVVSGKDPSILIVDKKAAAPREALEQAPDFDQAKAIAAEKAAEVPDVPKVGELALARAENRAPAVDKLTDAELTEFATQLGLKPEDYATKAGIVRAVNKKLKE